jgi:hypothetical protein
MNAAARRNRRFAGWLAAAATLVLCGPGLGGAAPQAAAPEAPPAPLEGAQAEAFLRAAPIVDRRSIGSGITRSEKLTLCDGVRTARAAWKTIHERVMGLSKMADGRVEFDFRDSWKHDVAAYELDKLLGLGLVPPTVERRIDGRRGALQLWIEGAMTELDRRRGQLQPPDPRAWNERRAAVALLRELAYDTDYNVQNTLYGPGFRVYAIDFSRAFRISPRLLSAERLSRLSPETVQRLRRLDRATLEARLSPWLDGLQLAGLLARRDAIVALADGRLAAAASRP